MNELKKIEKIKPDRLLTLAREVLDTSTDFNYLSGVQPFLISFEYKKYYIYIKNISSAYFSDRDKTTRAQLPIKPVFDEIKDSPHPFIFLGYDGTNDVYVCWNFHIAKKRLNAGKSVSFYSRTFFQSEVKEDEFVRRTLKNGDSPIFFKRSNLINFFKEINSFFPETTNIEKADIIQPQTSNEEQYIVNGKLIKITNEHLINEIQPYLQSNRILSAAQIVGKFYSDQFPLMDLKDWISLVKTGLI